MAKQELKEEMRCSGTEVILVTGGSGLIGSAIIQKMAVNYRMVGFDKGMDSRPPVVAEMVYMDLTSIESITEALHRVRYGYGNKIAAVIHLAAYYNFAGKPSTLYDLITVEGTRKLLSVLREMEIEQFIFSSSLLVYQPVLPGQKITEQSPLQPKWDYPLSKVKAEKVIRRESGNIPAVILRIAGVYNDDGSSIPITRHIQRIYEKKIESHFYPGNVKHGNPYIHLDDLVQAIIKTVEKRKEIASGTIINIGEAETLSFEDLQMQIGELLYGKPWKTYRIPKLLAKAGAWIQDVFGNPFIKPWMIDMADDHMELDITQAKKILDWEPRKKLSTTLPEIIKRLKDNPDGWYEKNRLNK